MNIKTMRWTFLIIALILGIVYTKHQYTEHKEKVAAEKRQAVIYAAAHPPTLAPTAARSISNRFQTSGSSHTTKGAPLRVYLDPKKVHLRPSGPVCYTLEADSAVSICDTAPGTTIDHAFEEDWWNMPAGWYLVSPLGAEKRRFRWY